MDGAQDIRSYSCQLYNRNTWWRHQMETFSALLALCAGNSPVNSHHKGQRRGTLMFTLICALNKRLSEQEWGWWFETRLRSLWRHCNDLQRRHDSMQVVLRDFMTVNTYLRYITYQMCLSSLRRFEKILHNITQTDDAIGIENCQTM